MCRSSSTSRQRALEGAEDALAPRPVRRDLGLQAREESMCEREGDARNYLSNWRRDPTARDDELVVARVQLRSVKRVFKWYNDREKRIAGDTERAGHGGDGADVVQDDDAESLDGYTDEESRVLKDYSATRAPEAFRVARVRPHSASHVHRSSVAHAPRRPVSAGRARPRAAQVARRPGETLSPEKKRHGFAWVPPQIENSKWTEMLKTGPHFKDRMLQELEKETYKLLSDVLQPRTRASKRAEDTSYMNTGRHLTKKTTAKGAPWAKIKVEMERMTALEKLEEVGFRFAEQRLPVAVGSAFHAARSHKVMDPKRKSQVDLSSCPLQGQRHACMKSKREDDRRPHSSTDKRPTQRAPRLTEKELERRCAEAEAQTQLLQQMGWLAEFGIRKSHVLQTSLSKGNKQNVRRKGSQHRSNNDVTTIARDATMREQDETTNEAATCECVRSELEETLHVDLQPGFIANAGDVFLAPNSSLLNLDLDIIQQTLPEAGADCAPSTEESCADITIHTTDDSAEVSVQQSSTASAHSSLQPIVSAEDDGAQTVCSVSSSNEGALVIPESDANQLSSHVPPIGDCAASIIQNRGFRLHRREHVNRLVRLHLSEDEMVSGNEDLRLGTRVYAVDPEDNRTRDCISHGDEHLEVAVATENPVCVDAPAQKFDLSPSLGDQGGSSNNDPNVLLFDMNRVKLKSLLSAEKLDKHPDGYFVGGTEDRAELITIDDEGDPHQEMRVHSRGKSAAVPSVNEPLAVEIAEARVIDASAPREPDECRGVDELDQIGGTSAAAFAEDEVIEPETEESKALKSHGGSLIVLEGKSPRSDDELVLKSVTPSDGSDQLVTQHAIMLEDRNLADLHRHGSLDDKPCSNVQLEAQVRIYSRTTSAAFVCDVSTLMAHAFGDKPEPSKPEISDNSVPCSDDSNASLGHSCLHLNATIRVQRQYRRFVERRNLLDQLRFVLQQHRRESRKKTRRLSANPSPALTSTGVHVTDSSLATHMLRQEKDSTTVIAASQNDVQARILEGTSQNILDSQLDTGRAQTTPSATDIHSEDGGVESPRDSTDANEGKRRDQDTGIPIYYVASLDYGTSIGVNRANSASYTMLIEESAPIPAMVAENELVDGAPDGPWERHLDAATNKSFYFHPRRNISRWDRPLEEHVVDKVESSKEAQNPSSNVAGTTTASASHEQTYGLSRWRQAKDDASLLESNGGWDRYLVKNSAVIFYHHAQRDEYVLESARAPEEFALTKHALDRLESDDKVQWSMRRNRSIRGDNHGEWEAFVDDETHQTFYYNSQTGACTWEKPATFTQAPAASSYEWVMYADPATSQPYYVNLATSETTWERPAGFEGTVCDEDLLHMDAVSDESAAHGGEELDEYVITISDERALEL